jgi:hypothetical protein
MQYDDTVNKPWFNSKVSGSVIFHIMDFKMLVMYIFAHVCDCTPTDFINGIHSSVVYGELCAHVIMKSN